MDKTIQYDKNERIEVRVSSRVKTLIQKAAKISGLSVSEFMVQKMAHISKDVVEEEESFLKSERDKEDFFTAITSDLTAPQRLKKALKDFKNRNEE